MECLETCHVTPRLAKPDLVHGLSPELSTASSNGNASDFPPRSDSDAAVESEEEQMALEMTIEGVCQVCESHAVWVAVGCMADVCVCEDRRWGLCEPCCETLLHEECLTKQVQAKQIADAKESMEAQGSMEWEPAAMEVEYWSAEAWYQHTQFEQFAQQPFFFEPGQTVPTLSELRSAGANLNHICVNFAANGHCPRGEACRWIHCRTGC